MPRSVPLRVLNEILHCTSLGIQAVLLKFLLAPGAGKEPALVGLGLHMNFKNPDQLSLPKDHRRRRLYQEERNYRIP